MVVLTNRRLLAVRQGRRGPAARPSLEAERTNGHVEVRRRFPLLGTWTVFVFHDRQLKLLVGRTSRDQVEKMQAALQA
jgi:hypothetical protein